ncbi:Alpha/beta-Hydrolases superfamily protein [Rhynchospora pubera]|uniref:Alpha/beta-Hydrolases superfamily protein n=1 Tax=Rhynchospora pubera TaxID=906938 RepID=A0AAV8DRB7_9POAL|nr:Alpha/beta-Hydrolases superfamily protein [Rhynchospora pubera]
MSSHPILHANKTSPFGDLTPDEFYQKHQVHHTHSFISSNNKIKLYTQTWRPVAQSQAHPPCGVVAMIHGYASESGWVFETTAVAIAKLGFLVCAIDLPGHGRSEGPRGHIPSVTPVIDNCIQFFDEVRASNRHLPAFLYGESLGGAIAMFICLRQTGKWHGLVLNGAMCGVSRNFKPVWPLEKLLPAAAMLAPNWRVVVSGNLVDRSYKEKWKRELVRRCPRTRRVFEHPPASTALELLRVCEEVGRRCREVDLPLLVLHGEDDVVCDVESAELVYELAASTDKTLKVVPGMGHQLIGEGKEILEEGFGVVFSWLKERIKK